MNEGYEALLVAILTDSNVEQAFLRLESGGKRRCHKYSDDEIEEMLAMRKQGMTWESIGKMLGASVSSVHHACKRYAERAAHA